MIRITSCSEPGEHQDNEDAFVVRPHTSDADRWICILADGQGGCAGGAEAARIACQTATAAALRQPAHALTEADRWAAILREADLAVLSDSRAGFTTLLGFLVTREFVVGASCGDSAIALRSSSEPVRDLTKGQRKNPAVGSGVAEFVPFSASLAWPWSVIAMSDGVWKYVGWDRLDQAARAWRGEVLVKTLQGFARLPRSGQFPDDFTVVLFEHDD
jgi:PPM family protein phosphatase